MRSITAVDLGFHVEKPEPVTPILTGRALPAEGSPRPRPLPYVPIPRRPRPGVRPMGRPVSPFWAAISRRLGLNTGLSEAAPAAPGFWGSLGNTLGGIVSNVLPAFAQIEIAKKQTQAGAALYTPQNIEILRRQAEYEAQVRANAAAAAAGSTSAPISTNTLLLVGGGLAAVLVLMNMRRK